ncbi:pyrroline-5-carboxylate reductase [Pradoshia sp.]
MDKKIAFIGAGSMAEALISGLVTRKGSRPENIWISNRANDSQLARLQKEYGVTPSRDFSTLLRGADVVLIAVKPKDVLATLTQAKEYLKEDMLLISVAAGISTASLKSIVDIEIPIIRAMPNTSAAVGKSATALSGNEYVKEKDKQLAKSIFGTVGMAVYTDEDKMDAVTGLSGSGPAYIYYLIEAMQLSAEQIGLEPQDAQKLIIQTLMGAAEMVHASDKTPETLRLEVTSPGGTTEAGIRVLEEKGVKEALIECIKTATHRSSEMGEELSEKINQGILSN